MKRKSNVRLGLLLVIGGGLLSHCGKGREHSPPVVRLPYKDYLASVNRSGGVPANYWAESRVEYLLTDLDMAAVSPSDVIMVFGDPLEELRLTEGKRLFRYPDEIVRSCWLGGLVRIGDKWRSLDDVFEREREWHEDPRFRGTVVHWYFVHQFVPDAPRDVGFSGLGLGFDEDKLSLIVYPFPIVWQSSFIGAPD